MNDTPYIHLFETPLGYYVYDVNTNNIIKIENELYDYLSGKAIKTQRIDAQIELLKRNGYLRTDRVEKTEHPMTELLPIYLDTKVGQLLLQVTQNCNLRCEYCIYSGNYNTREHSSKRMTWETAKKAIDFLIEHSKERQDIVLGFYGGEPLLAFGLIKECVEYIEQLASGKRIEYSITTNGTLINREVIEFFVKYKFTVTVSIDGPKEIHDQSRRFFNSNIGSFDTMIENVKCIRNYDEDYFNRYVRFNAVLLTDRSFNCVDDYFKGDDLFSEFSVSANIVSDSFSKTENKISSSFVEEQQYELFKFYLSKLRRLDPKKASSIFYKRYELIKKISENREEKSRECVPKKWHRGGPCIPGVFRTFVTVDGKLFPCEKVCEISKSSMIGTLEEGYDLDNIKKLLNIEKYTTEHCRECWAYSECTSCIQCMDENLGIRDSILSKCSKIRKDIEGRLKDYTVLRELGCSFYL